MGLGKTVQAIAALRILYAQQKLSKALIVVPSSLIVQWRKEIKHWAPELRISTVRGSVADRSWQWDAPAQIYIVGYETLRSDFTSNPQSPPRRTIWDVVILDEAQKIKNRDVEVSSKCKQLFRRRSWALTGTPLENKADDLCSILEFVAPLAEAERPRRLEWNDQTRSRHRNLQLRRRKAEVLPQLPPKVTSKVTLTLEGSQRASYDRAEKEGVLELKQKGETVRIQNVLELIIRLKQICNFCPTSGKSAKLTDVRERLSTLRAQGHRALIFSQFTDLRFGVRAIAAAIETEMPLIYTGDMGPKRDAVIKEFKEDETRRVLILSLKAGGQGLNLQEASYVFHFDRWWNPAIENQADARSHRLGQQHPVNVYKYVCEGTIEERIDELLAKKQELFDELVDDVSMDLRTSLTGEQLFGLFGLKPPAAEERLSK